MSMRWLTRTLGLGVPTLILVIVTAMALFPALFTSESPITNDVGNALAPPGLGHPFGTDNLGRDVFSRTVYGTRTSLLVGVGATGIGLVGGLILGVIAALGPRWLDAVVSRVLDVLLAFPNLLLALVVIAFFGRGTLNVLVSIGVAAIPAFARLVRSEIMVVRNAGYIEAAVAIGSPPWRYVVRQVLPNSLTSVVVLATLGVGTSIIAASGLSFLGLGPEPPTPEWGLMLAAARDLLAHAWWMGLFPGIVLTATVISVTLLGRKFKAHLDGRTT